MVLCFHRYGLCHKKSYHKKGGGTFASLPNMHRRVLALSALALASVPAAAAFAAPVARLPRIACVKGDATTVGIRAAPALRAGRRVSGLRATLADTGVPEGQKAFEAAERTMDEWFALLADRWARARWRASACGRVRSRDVTNPARRGAMAPACP
jgi:hypothetical protein